MADGPSPAKAQKLDTGVLPECPYGARCYRKNPQHFKEFSHSSDSSTKDGTVDSSFPLKKSATAVVDTSNLPPCKYGVNCYRKNLLHFAEFSHPTSKSSEAAKNDGSDTDVYSSGDEQKSDKGNEKKEVLSKDLSLLKRFSQLTDDERKELIKRAFEEKLRLEQELDGAKKAVEEKDKELQHLQKQLNNGLLLVEGEEEAMKKTETTYFELLPERAYKEGSASQTHFRLAESQFYRLVTGNCVKQVRVIKVEYVVSPQVVKKFREYQAKLKKDRGENFSYPVLGFHGTDEKNIKPICEGGFKTPEDKGFHHMTDTGFYGAGVYFSEYPSYSMAYIRGGTKLMLCQVLPGKVYECKKLIMGSKLMKGFDSHMSPCKKELVIFHSAAILPCYIIYFKYTQTEFTYSTPEIKGPKGGSKKAAKVHPSKIFKGLNFAVTGKLSDSQENIFALIEKHGGSRGTKNVFNILVASEDSFMTSSAKVIQAEKKGVPIVKEAYIHDCIEQQATLNTSDYVVDE